jgi:hypothetical protein
MRAGGVNRGKRRNKMVLYVLIFAVVTFFVSFLVGRSNDLDRGKVATYVALVAWGSLLCGLYLAKIQP